MSPSLYHGEFQSAHWRPFLPGRNAPDGGGRPALTGNRRHFRLKPHGIYAGVAPRDTVHQEARSVGEIVSPSALAVFRSRWVQTGPTAQPGDRQGFAPLRILSTYSANLGIIGPRIRGSMSISPPSRAIPPIRYIAGRRRDAANSRTRCLLANSIGSANTWRESEFESFNRPEGRVQVI